MLEMQGLELPVVPRLTFSCRSLPSVLGELTFE